MEIFWSKTMETSFGFHPGGEDLTREAARAAGVPMTNYGILIAKLSGIPVANREALCVKSF